MNLGDRYKLSVIWPDGASEWDQRVVHNSDVERVLDFLFAMDNNNNATEEVTIHDKDGTVWTYSRVES